MIFTFKNSIWKCKPLSDLQQGRGLAADRGASRGTPAALRRSLHRWALRLYASHSFSHDPNAPRFLKVGREVRAARGRTDRRSEGERGPRFKPGLRIQSPAPDQAGRHLPRQAHTQRLPLPGCAPRPVGPHPGRAGFWLEGLLFLLATPCLKQALLSLRSVGSGLPAFRTADRLRRLTL